MQGHIQLNGSKTAKDIYVWGAALTLAWKHLCQQIIKQPIRINSENAQALQITQNFNRSPCHFGMMNQKCYYARAGYGNKTVHLINEEVKKKFPQKTTSPIQANLDDSSIISYAYFFKKLLFEKPFNKKDVHFNRKSVPGFVAKEHDQLAQVKIYENYGEENFIIQLETKQKNDHIFIYKVNKDLKPQQVLEKINSLKKPTGHLEKGDVFEMPKIQLKHKRDVKQLIGVYLKNQQFKQYFFAQIYEIINLDLDQKGVKVQNQGVIVLSRSMPMQLRRFVLDKPFWIIMRQKEQHPYFLAYINQVSDK